MTPPAVGAKAVLKPTIAITTSAKPVIRIVLSRLKCSPSPSSPISKKPTEIVIVKTSSAAIRTQRLFVVWTMRSPSLPLGTYGLPITQQQEPLGDAAREKSGQSPGGRLPFRFLP